MKIDVSSDAEADIVQGYWFYESQKSGLGDYFQESIVADIESLIIYAGIHEVAYGYHRLLCNRFPFAVYYRVAEGLVTIVAVLDSRQNPSWTRERLK